MAAKKTEQKESFWQQYKFYIVGLLGAILLVSFFGVQSVVVSYQTETGESYSAKMDFTAFGMCINCMGVTDNAQDIVEKELFTFSMKKDCVIKAANALYEIAEKEDGEFLVRVSGVMGNNDKNTENLIDLLESKGYQAEPMQ